MQYISAPPQVNPFISQSPNIIKSNTYSYPNYYTGSRNDYYWEEDHVSSEEEFLHHDIHTIKTIILLTLLPTILLPLLLACICFSHISLLLFLLKFKFLPIPVIVRQPPQPTGGCGNLLIRQVSVQLFYLKWCIKLWENFHFSYWTCRQTGKILTTIAKLKVVV